MKSMYYELLDMTKLSKRDPMVGILAQRYAFGRSCLRGVYIPRCSSIADDVGGLTYFNIYCEMEWLIPPMETARHLIEL